MDFDPDKFLAGQSQNNGSDFDPDAFLSGKQQISNAERIEPGIYGDTDPVGQRLVENLGKVAGGFAVGDLGAMLTGKAAGGIKSLFSYSPDLLNAGIKPQTILKMTPRGMNPAEFGSTLQDTLNGEGALGKDASDTWNRVNSLKNKAGVGVENALQAIAKKAASSGADNPLAVEAQEALQPVFDGWLQHADAATTTARRMAKPFEQVYSKLSAAGAQNGGYLTLDHIRDVMDEIGPMTHKGPEEMQEAMSRLYGSLADARDGMIQKVAQQANDPALAQNLLDNNAAYSRYMRLIPDVSKAASAYSIKEGVSAFERYGGPTFLKYALPYLGLRFGADEISKIFGDEKGNQ